MRQLTLEFRARAEKLFEAYLRSQPFKESTRNIYSASFARYCDFCESADLRISKTSAKAWLESLKLGESTKRQREVILEKFFTWIRQLKTDPK